jgi:hypothetical protein
VQILANRNTYNNCSGSHHLRTRDANSPSSPFQRSKEKVIFTEEEQHTVDVAYEIFKKGKKRREKLQR